MSSLTRCQHLRLMANCTAFALLSLFFQGCGSGEQSAQQALNKAFADNPQAQRVQVCKFEGTVTVDGYPPDQSKSKLLIILNDPDKPQDPKKNPTLLTGVDDEGHFAFSTYDAHDGVSSGKYIVTFVKLHKKGKFQIRRRDMTLEQPDDLKNLYSDPDKNKDIPEFNVDITPPGKTDWKFDLVVEGKDPVAKPGPHAVLRIDNR